MEETLNWNCEMEVNLFHALRGHKPVGVNRHFHMVSIHEKLSSSYKKITTKQIWDYLNTLFNLSALNESEILPFPNKVEDFSLPENDFTELIDKSFPRMSVHKSDSDKRDRNEKPEKPGKLDKHERSKDDRDERTDTGSKSTKPEGRHSVGTPIINTPDNSPKRKRTRQTPSTASPSTPDAPPHKRRR